MTADISKYLDLITSEHADKQNFTAWVGTLVQPFADIAELVASFPSLYDIDVAVGEQLDAVGEWIGISRFLDIPLTGVYFSFDMDDVGFDQGTWLGPFDPTDGLVALPDDSYRTLLYAKIANNQWNGTIPSAYIFLEKVFPGDQPFIQDNGDMTMLVGVVGPVPLNAVTYSLLTHGYLDVKPVGVRIAGYVTTSVPGAPLFGFDLENTTISGFDVGAWAIISGGT